MVGVATALGKNGLQDWLIQRVSAVIMALYTVTIVACWFVIKDGDIQGWKTLFSTIYMRTFTLLALLALVAHAWIGFWTVSTDYIKDMWMRLTAQVIIYIVLFLYLVWGIQILWGW